jgi:hypothetical protein
MIEDIKDKVSRHTSHSAQSVQCFGWAKVRGSRRFFGDFGLGDLVL